MYTQRLSDCKFIIQETLIQYSLNFLSIIYRYNTWSDFGFSLVQIDSVACNS